MGTMMMIDPTARQSLTWTKKVDDDDSDDYDDDSDDDDAADYVSPPHCWYPTN